MASIPYAYNEELKEVISSDDAYDFFWDGTLQDKKKFLCPGNNCNAKITCANMDTSEIELKQTPHFRVMSPHEINCEYVEFLMNEGENKKKNGDSTGSGKQNIPEFILIRNNIKQRKDISPNKPEFQPTHLKVPDGYGQYSAHPKYSSIRPIVDRFFEYREDNILEEKYLKISGQQISFKKLFKGVFNQDVSKLLDKDYIYWGVAFINRTKNGAYQINFQKKMLLNNDEKKYRYL